MLHSLHSHPHEKVDFKLLLKTFAHPGPPLDPPLILYTILHSIIKIFAGFDFANLTKTVKTAKVIGFKSFQLYMQ